MEQVIKFLDGIFPLSPALLDRLSTVLLKKEIPRRYFLLKAGHVCQNVYFIESGLLRCFYEKSNHEICSWFMREGDVIVSVESFFDQKPSYESIQALEDTTVYYISFQELEYIYRNHIEFNYIGRVLVQHYYKLSEQRLYSMRLQTAYERYRFLVQHFPEIVHRVSTTDVASYLGVTRETLSRLKKTSLKKNT